MSPSPTSSCPTSSAPTPSSSSYEVIYWPGFLGRSQVAVLLLEDAGATYTTNTDVQGFLASNTGFPAFACPIVKKEGGPVVSQTPAIAYFLGKELGYAPAPEDEANALSYALNVADILAEGERGGDE